MDGTEAKDREREDFRDFLKRAAAFSVPPPGIGDAERRLAAWLARNWKKDRGTR